MRITKKQLKRIIKEEMDDVGGGAYISHGGAPGGARATAPRTGETVQLGVEIERLAEEAGTDPHSYLVDLGFSEQGADNLLGMANLFDKIKSGMTFEGKLREKKRSAKGNITQDTREKYATVGKDKFPIFDKKSAEAAIDLRGHTSAANQKKIIDKAAKYAPAAAKKAREVEKKKKK